MLYDSLHESQLISLFYVSRSSLQESKAQEEVSNIVSFALSNNAGLSVTGALLYTGAHFAQVLEGPQKGVAEVMSKIEKDTRTADATIVEIQQITKRKFPNWAMAYSGPSPFLDRHIKPLLSPFTSDGPREELIASLQEKLLRFITAKTADDDPRPPSKLHLVGGIEMIGVPPRQEDDRPLV